MHHGWRYKDLFLWRVVKVRDFIQDIIQQALPEVIHPVATVGSLEDKEQLTIFGAIQEVCSYPAGRIPVRNHMLGRISIEVDDPHACVLMVMRRDGGTNDILWESDLLVTKGADQILECVVVERSHTI